MPYYFFPSKLSKKRHKRAEPATPFSFSLPKKDWCPLVSISPIEEGRTQDTKKEKIGDANTKKRKGVEP